MRYLDPKADLTFKKVFGEHPDLVISLLNALLPFDEPEEEIAEIEYLTPELVPETPLKKNSIVDVRCKDKMGRQFLVEMQMLWSPAFMQRVLFNASKAYVRQLGGRESKYELLQPVYSLNLVNDIFLPDVPEAYHDYKIVQKGKKMAVLWLRYLTEIDEHTRQAPKELLENPEINKAVTQIEESAFNDAQLWWYDDFWDAVRVENTLISDALREGRQKGMEEGRQEGIQEGIRQNNIQNARGMKAEGIPTGTIAKITGLSPDEIEKL